jgi:hypothetical protein
MAAYGYKQPSSTLLIHGCFPPLSGHRCFERLLIYGKRT